MDFTSNFAWIEGTDIDEEVLRNNQTMKTGCFDDNQFDDFLKFGVFESQI